MSLIQFLNNNLSHIPWKKNLILTHAEAFGDEIEKFRNPEFALINWLNKQMQSWELYSFVQTQNGRNFNLKANFKLYRTHNDDFAKIPIRLFKPDIISTEFIFNDQNHSNQSQCFDRIQKNNILNTKTGYTAQDKFLIEYDGWYFKRNPTGTFSLYLFGHNKSVHLHLTPSKPLIYHGQRGFFQLGDNTQTACFYCSYSNLQTKGEIIIDDKLFEVTGTTWLDHKKQTTNKEQNLEFQNNFLIDYIVLTLPTQEEIMLTFIFDKKSMKLTRQSIGSFIDRNGAHTHLIAEDFIIENIKNWVSPKTKSRYPIYRKIEITPLNLKIEIEPVISECEIFNKITTSIPKWNGPIKAVVYKNNEPLQSKGFALIEAR